MSAWVPVSYHPEITETYNGYGCLTVEVLLSDDRVFDAEFEFWEREYDWFVYPPATPMDGWRCALDGSNGTGNPSIKAWRVKMVERFPFRHGEIIQHVSGTGDKFIVRLVDDAVYEAFAESLGPKYGPGTRVINPANWMKVAA